MQMGIDWRPLRQGALVMAGILVGLWVLEILDTLTGHGLDGFGIRSWELSGLSGILAAPLLHFGFGHLAANSVPLFLLGTAIWASGVRQWVVSTVVSWITSGLLAWLLTPLNHLIVGASGIVFGWIVYLVLRGFLTRDWKHVVLGLVVMFGYGSVLLGGILPFNARVSWQGHLGGAIGGGLAAYLLHRRASRSTN